jgi:hypothetical protein
VLGKQYSSLSIPQSLGQDLFETKYIGRGEFSIFPHLKILQRFSGNVGNSFSRSWVSQGIDLCGDVVVEAVFESLAGRFKLSLLLSNCTILIKGTDLELWTCPNPYRCFNSN